MSTNHFLDELPCLPGPIRLVISLRERGGEVLNATPLYPLNCWGGRGGDYSPTSGQRVEIEGSQLVRPSEEATPPGSFLELGGDRRSDGSRFDLAESWRVSHIHT